MKVHNRALLLFFTAAAFSLTIPMVKATPYASCITNNAGTIIFYLNESGGNVVVTYEDGSTNAGFDGQTTGLNLPSGQYSFPLNNGIAHTSYTIAVTKMGTGVAGIEPNVIQNTNAQTILTLVTNLFIIGNPRGVAVNINPTSPYFGRIYVSRGGGNAGQQLFFDLNSDGTFSTAGPNGTNAGVTTWTAGSPYSSPDRITLAANDDLVVGDYSVPNAGVWLVGPNLDTNELLLGPIGDGIGIAQGVHGAEVANPIMLGDPATNATLFTVDGDLNTNRIEIYSNITQTALASGNGWQAVPNLTGPQVAINLPENPNGPGFYFFPSLCIGPNGYIYSGEYRGGANGSLGAGDYAGVQVYGLRITNQLFNSRYNGGKSDYFATASTGGSSCLPTDLAVSPDGKYLATVGVDNHLTICVLTNGIPDVASIYTVRPLNYGAEYADGATEVKWDLADNLYVLAAGTFGLTTWTLGQSATCTTYGNANGPTNFALVSLNPSISVYATNPPVISQINTHGNPTNGTFTIIRSGGNLSQALTVNFAYSGTAPNGTYTVGSSGSVVLQPGQTVTNISVAAVSDGVPRLTTTLTLTLTSSVNYTVLANSATITILNAATPQLKAAAGLASMYNAFSNDYCSVVITRLGDTNTTETVSGPNFTLAGTGVQGTDFTAPIPLTFNPGDLTQTTYIYPLTGGAVPTHNPNLTYTGNKTVVLGLSAGSGYTVTTNTATLTILDSAYPPATVLFSDPLTNAMDATNWGVNVANGNLDNISPDTTVQFGGNLYNTPNYPVPAPPNGATNALQMTVTKNSGFLGDPVDNPMTAVNLYLTNHVFGGNYAVRFNMNVLQGDSTSLEYDLPGGVVYDAEEGPLFGINNSGTQTNWWAGSGFFNGNSQTNFGSDGIWYWASDNGGNYLDTASYLEFTGLGGALPNTGWTNLARAVSGTFATTFKSNVFTCYSSANVPPYQTGWAEGGPGLVANGPPSLVGSNPNSWSDVEIKQVGRVVSLWIDKTRIFNYTNPATSTFTNGQIMLGYEDPYDGAETPDTAVYFSNLRVVALTPPALSGFAVSGSNFSFTFTSSDGDLTAASFAVQGSTNVLTGYADVNNATISQVSHPGVEMYQATVPMSGPDHFYRVRLK